MSFERWGQSSLDLAPVSYGSGRVFFRGPKPHGTGYYAFLGGSDTEARFAPAPFPTLVGTALNAEVMNLGVRGAGPDVFLNLPEVAGAMAKARAVIIDLPLVSNLTNRFYRVHPLRNDRVLTGSDALRALVPDTDLVEVCFTQHMLQAIDKSSPVAARAVHAALRAKWQDQMRRLVASIRVPCVLVHHGTGRVPVTPPMIEGLRGQVAAVVEAPVTDEARAEGAKFLVAGAAAPPGLAQALSARAHGDLAQALIPVLQAL